MAETPGKKKYKPFLPYEFRLPTLPKPDYHALVQLKQILNLKSSWHVVVLALRVLARIQETHPETLADYVAEVSELRVVVQGKDESLDSA